MLNMSRLALSRSIQELEEGLAAQLFFHCNEGVTLIDVSEGSYQYASLIPEELHAAQEDIRQRQGQLAGQINVSVGASISRSPMPAVISCFHQQHPQIKVHIMEGQLVSMINELRQEELDFTTNTHYQGPYDYELIFEKLLKKQFAIFRRPGHPAIGARSIKQLLDCNWIMPTPHGSYYKQLSELLDNQTQTSQVGVVCKMLSVCVSLAAKSDFLSILPEEMGCDPLHGRGLVMLSVSEILPKATYYSVQRHGSRQTPLTASLITQFRRECGYLQS